MDTKGQKDLATKIILGMALGITLCIGQQPVEAATYDVHNEGEAWTKLGRYPSVAEQPEEVYRYYGEGSKNTLNLWANPITGKEKLYASQFYAGFGSDHTLNFNGGGDSNLEVMAGTASNNTLNGSGGQALFLYGAWNSGKDNANGNKVSFSGGNVQGVYGGYVGDNGTGNADNNTVEISGGKINGDGYALAIAGHSAKGSANNNSITVSGGSFHDAFLYGGRGRTAADGNIVNVSSFSGDINRIYGGFTSGSKVTTASNNTVTLGNKGDGIYSDYYYIAGGYASSDLSDGSATASNNKVQILGGTYTHGTIHGGTAYVSQYGPSVTVSNNIVEIKGGVLKGSTPYSYSYIYGGSAQSGKVEGNSVIIRGGTIYGFVYAGDAGERGEELNNSIDVYKGANLEKAELYGTQYKTDAAALKQANPVLNVHASNIKVKKIGSFAKINYNLPNTVKNGDIILEADEAVLNNTEIGVSAPGGTSLDVDDKIYLLTAKEEITGELGETEAIFSEGVSIQRTMDISLVNNTLVGTLTDGPHRGGGSEAKLNDQTKSLVETTAAAMAVLNNSADFVASQGFSAASVAAAADPGSYSPFFAAGGSNMRLNTGSHVDSKGYGFAIGLAKEIKCGKQTLLTGPFVEHGSASYDSYLDDGTHGDGRNRFTGGGWFLRSEQRTGFLYEASLRFGHLTSDYNGTMNLPLGPQSTSYDSSSNYYGFHLGVGHRWAQGKNDSLDLYAKYFYTHQNGTDATLSTGESYHFDAVKSSRTRLGLRYTHQATSLCNVYGGIAWDYEFDSNARATYRGLATPTASMKGSSGMAELGVKFRPDEKNPLTMDLSVQGWTGKQKGFAANLGLQWSF